MSKIHNTQVENTKAAYVVMLTYNLREYSDNYLKTSKSLYQFCRHEPKNPLTDLNHLNLKQY